ncbi:hypothetical protein GH714_032994 [Hevea brasiliensis]|uniref:Shugoshin C-terminal domain-containing protein n=1 Tax=Hevea brasiliensis TaxID=3981 RepID=A0A6A6L490_HEVBR|nr:hypothetical protein GH714_032994 [Hevea brasiliensis]
MGDGSKVGNMPRKTLADISNLPQQNQDKRAESVSVSTKDYINKLHQLKVLQHELGCKNGLLKARELKSEVCLATSPFALSLDPTTVKPVQLKEKIDKKRHSARFRAGKEETTDDVLEISENPIGEPVQAEKRSIIRGALGSTTVTPVQTEMKVDNKRHGSRRQSARFKPGKQESTDDMFEINGALGSTTVTPVQTEMKVDNKRHGSRRQSARFKCGEQVQEPTEGLFEKDDSKFPISNLHECGPTSSFSSLKVETEEAHSDLGSEAQELQTSSVRPKRQATEKVQSYRKFHLMSRCADLIE